MDIRSHLVCSGTHSERMQAMADQGSGGAFEISQRMTAMLGWGATSDFKEDWTWNQAAETYAMDPEMAEKLKKKQPSGRKIVLRSFHFSALEVSL